MRDNQPFPFIVPYNNKYFNSIQQEKKYLGGGEGKHNYLLLQPCDQRSGAMSAGKHIALSPTPSRLHGLR